MRICQLSKCMTTRMGYSNQLQLNGNFSKIAKLCLQKVWYSCCRDECYSRNPRDKEDKKSAGKHKTVLNTTNPNNKKATRFRITLGQEMRCTYFTNVKHHMGYSHN